jgi:glucose uptake protein GlcU
MCAGFGMVGATIAAIRKYYSKLISESTAKATGNVKPPLDWGLGWIYYYMSRPILGAILGALSYTLSFVGVLILTNGRDIVISNEGRFLLNALAFVSGFAVSQVLDRLGAVSKQIFRASTNSDNK